MQPDDVICKINQLYVVCQLHSFEKWSAVTATLKLASHLIFLLRAIQLIFIVCNILISLNKKNQQYLGLFKPELHY